MKEKSVNLRKYILRKQKVKQLVYKIKTILNRDMVNLVDTNCWKPLFFKIPYR